MRFTHGLIVLPALLLAGCPTKAKPDFDAGKQSDGSGDGSGDGAQTTPTLQITSPSDGTYAKGTLAVTVKATGGSTPATVSLLVDGGTTPVGTATAPSPYDFSWNTTGVTDGPHTLIAKAIVAGQAIMSAPITVHVDHTPPTVTVTTPAVNATNVVLRAPITVTFSEAVAKSSLTSSSVTLTIGGTAVATTVTLSSDGTVATIAINDLTSFALPAAFSVTLAASIMDLAGNALVPPTPAWSWMVPDFISYGSVAGFGFGLWDLHLAVTTSFRPVIGYSDHFVGASGSVQYDALHVQTSDGQAWTDLGWPSSGGNANVGISLALNAQDQPMVASSVKPASGPAQVYVSTWNGATWGVPLTPMDSSGLGGGDATFPILRLDPSDLPVIAWIEQRSAIVDNDIFITRWTGTQWSPSPGELGLSGIASFDLILDTQGNASVGWHSSNMTGVDTFRGTTELVSPTMAATIDPSLGLDGTSEPLIVTAGGAFVVSTLVAGAWQQVIPMSIPAGGTAGDFKLRMGPDHNPIVGWTDSGLIGYARWNGTAWDTRAGLLSEGAGNSADFDLAVDSRGTVWIAGTVSESKVFALMSNY